MRRRRRRILVAASVLFACGCQSMVKAAIEPNHPFDAEEAPAPPDYTSASMWAALPDRADGADVTPPGVADGQRDAPVDVFFIHPTTYFSGQSWNQPLDHERANRGVDEKVLPNQASAFNGIGRVYAPRYRQATLGTFTSASLVERNKALDLAFDDVRRAFDYFVEHHNGGRPFILASHSQGSQHAARLLHTISESPELRERLVAAYVIGTPIEERALERSFPNIGLCHAPDTTSCLINYNTIAPHADRTRFGQAFTWFPATGYTQNAGRPIICVNPISWRADGEVGPKSQHVGAWRQSDDENPPIDRHFVSAQCVDGLLVATASRDDYAFLLGRRGDLHLVDYSLFYMDIRENAARRVDAWHASHPRPQPNAPSGGSSSHSVE